MLLARGDHAFPGLPESIPQARSWIRSVLTEHALDLDVDLAETLTSELSTNAIRHTRSGQPGEHFWISWYLLSLDTLRVAIRDAGGSCVPHLAAVTFTLDGQVPEELPEAGRGLRMVAATAARWDATPVPPGYVVWFELGKPSDISTGTSR